MVPGPRAVESLSGFLFRTRIPRRRRSQSLVMWGGPRCGSFKMAELLPFQRRGACRIGCLCWASWCFFLNNSMMYCRSVPLKVGTVGTGEIFRVCRGRECRRRRCLRPWFHWCSTSQLSARSQTTFKLALGGWHGPEKRMWKSWLSGLGRDGSFVSQCLTQIHEKSGWVGCS